ncbi:hypothetical protein DL98DRAFT_536127 [Cadophora sp. DSE1049]|nr:hypothetical protein DL98DRAFT_536127 [Cadophora sp. DSE1049]
MDTLIDISKSSGDPIHPYNVRRGSAETSITAALLSEDSSVDDGPPLLVDIDVTATLLLQKSCSSSTAVIFVPDSDDEYTPEEAKDSNDDMLDTPEDRVEAARRKLAQLFKELNKELRKKPRANARKRTYAKFHYDSVDKIADKVEKTYKKLSTYRRMALGLK